MSSGQRKRIPENFPRMKYWAAQRHADNDPIVRFTRDLAEAGRALNLAIESWRQSVLTALRPFTEYARRAQAQQASEHTYTLSALPAVRGRVHTSASGVNRPPTTGDSS